MDLEKFILIKKDILKRGMFRPSCTLTAYVGCLTFFVKKRKVKILLVCFILYVIDDSFIILILVYASSDPVN